MTDLVRVMLNAHLSANYLPPERLLELQWAKLRRLLSFAYERIPFYRRRFAAIGAGPMDIKTPEDFRAFPVLTRDEILDHGLEMLALPRERLVKVHSGGSTGHPLDIYYRRADRRYRFAIRRRANGWLQAAWLWPSFKLWGVTGTNEIPPELSPLRRLAGLHHRYYYNHLAYRDLERLAADFLAVQPRKVYGFASLLRALAQFFLEEGRQVPHPPRVIVSAAEYLSPEDRALIEQGLGGPVYNRYASEENTVMASECLARQGLHVLADHVYLEILRHEAPARFGEPGYVVVTDLDNWTMPFIRYRNEDIASWSGRRCPCGRTMPLLEAVYGRQTDFIFDRCGVAHPGINLMRPLRPIAEHGHIRQFQLCQAARGQLEVLAVPGPELAAGDEALLTAALAEEFGGAMDISIRWVPAIPPEPSGKTRFTKSAVPFSALFGPS